MLDYFSVWIREEPFISVLLMLVAVGIFGMIVGKIDKDTSSAIWPWLRHLGKAASISLLCVCFLLACYEVLDEAVAEFSSLHTKITWDNWRNAALMWGTTLTQSELIVNHFVADEVEGREEFLTDESGRLTPQISANQRQFLPLNSITGFTGTVTIELSDSDERKQGAEFYNTYTAQARYEYEVTNVSDSQTEVEFLFPFFLERMLYDDFIVVSDGVDISSQCQYLPQGVIWKDTTLPQQQIQVTVYYTTTGIDSFYYQIPTRREISQFRLFLAVNTKDFFIIQEPETDILSPRRRLGKNEATLEWHLDQTVLAAKMGIALKQPERPYSPYLNLQHLVVYAPRALLLFGILVILTLLVWGESIRVANLALLMAGYSVQFFAVVGIGEYFRGIWYPWGIGAILTAVLISLWLRKYKSVSLRILLFVLSTLFTFYPLTSQLVELTQRDAVEGGVQVGIILYLFGVLFYTRVRDSLPRATHGG